MQISLGPPLDAADLRKIERHLHLSCNKWDTQVGDSNVLSEQPVILPETEWADLCRAAEQLAAETVVLESTALGSPKRYSLLGVPKAIWQFLSESAGTLTRVMRFDFHPTAFGWRVSEVNSDVPGGWGEGTMLPLLFQPFYNHLHCPRSPLAAWGDAIQPLAHEGHVALLTAPGFLEDEQVVRAFMGELRSRSVPCALIQSPAAVKACKLVSVLIRFYQLEWLCALPEQAGWKDMLGTGIPLINPTIAALSESKRFPLLFHGNPACPAWRSLMPECRDPREVGASEWDNWVLKATYSNTGDQVHIGRAIRPRLLREAQRNPLKWVAQRRFETLPIDSVRGPVHPCIGVFVVNGRAAGAYVRLSPKQVTDASAVEAPLLIDRRVF